MRLPGAHKSLTLLAESGGESLAMMILLPSNKTSYASSLHNESCSAIHILAPPPRMPTTQSTPARHPYRLRPAAHRLADGTLVLVLRKRKLIGVHDFRDFRIT